VGFLGVAVAAFVLPRSSLERAHVGVDFVYEKLSPRPKMFLKVFTRILVAVFFFVASWYFVEMAQSFIVTRSVTMTLKLPFYPVVYVLVFSFLVQGVVSILSDRSEGKRKEAGTMSEYVLGIGACVVLIVFLLTGIEIAFGIVLVGVVGLIITSGFDVAFNMVTQDFFDTQGSYSLTVIPLFMLMGQIAFHAGIAQRLYDAAYKLIGRVPGGLAMATVVAATCSRRCAGRPLQHPQPFPASPCADDQIQYSKRLSTE
jgi:TRAP-type C4-dicarboxylate transport system permease small subunit